MGQEKMLHVMIKSGISVFNKNAARENKRKDHFSGSQPEDMSQKDYCATISIITLPKASNRE